MALYKKMTTRALPAGAEQSTKNGERIARWKSSNGRTRTAKLTTGNDGQPRIVTESATYYAKYRDGEGIIREVATGCRDEQAARAVLAALEKRAENVRSGITTAATDAIIDHQALPLSVHLEAYKDHQNVKQLNATRLSNTRSRLRRLTTDCRWERLSDLTAVSLERWLLERTREGMSAGTRNEYRQEAIGFANWCLRSQRMLANPFLTVARADAKSDCRKKRRAMTEAELIKLLEVARWRPLAEYGRRTVAKDKGEVTSKRGTWNYAPLTLDDLPAAVETARRRLSNRPEFINELDRLGQERALIYKTLVLTGLRKGELASLTVAQLHLDGLNPTAELYAADEKNRQGSLIAIRSDLAGELRQWLDSKADRVASDSGRHGNVLPLRQQTKLAGETPLFVVPDGLVKILDRDLQTAGIAKRDERGRTLDVHALRHSFATLLSRGGVAPRTAQAAMRHSSLDLTMNVYTDPKLLDIHRAVDSLPALPLSSDPLKDCTDAKATGTNDQRKSLVAPTVALTRVKMGHSESIADKQAGESSYNNPLREMARNPEKSPKNASSNGKTEVAFQEPAKGIEPLTPALRMNLKGSFKDS